MGEDNQHRTDPAMVEAVKEEIKRDPAIALNSRLLVAILIATLVAVALVSVALARRIRDTERLDKENTELRLQLRDCQNAHK